MLAGQLLDVNPHQHRYTRAQPAETKVPASVGLIWSIFNLLVLFGAGGAILVGLANVLNWFSGGTSPPSQSSNHSTTRLNESDAAERDAHETRAAAKRAELNREAAERRSAKEAAAQQTAAQEREVAERTAQEKRAAAKRAELNRQAAERARARKAPAKKAPAKKAATQTDKPASSPFSAGGLQWKVPINALDATQRRIVSAIVDGPQKKHRISGPAGSGKSVVLVNAAEQVAMRSNRPRVVVATFTNSLSGVIQASLDAATPRNLVVSTLDSVNIDDARFVFIDEVQDLLERHEKPLKPLLEAVPVLVCAGDQDQQIYRTSSRWSLGSEWEDHELLDSYRISEAVFKVASAIHRTSTRPSARRLGHGTGKPTIRKAASRDEDFDVCFEEASRLAARQLPSAVLLPGRPAMTDFVKSLARQHGWEAPPLDHQGQLDRERHPNVWSKVNRYLDGYGLHIFQNGGGSAQTSERKPVVYLMTYHSAKGLEFGHVFLPDLTARSKLLPDRSEWGSEADAAERRLFYVAATRARRNLHLSYSGAPHKFIGEIGSHLLEVWTPLAPNVEGYDF